MGDFFVPQMDDLFTEGCAFIPPRRGKGERRFGAPPFCEGKAKGQSPVTWAPWELRLMRESGAPSTEEVAGVLSKVCLPPPGVLMSHHPRSRPTLQGLRANGRARCDGMLPARPE